MEQLDLESDYSYASCPGFTKVQRSTLKVPSEDRDADDDQLPLTHSEGLSRHKADQPNPPIPAPRSIKSTR